MMKTRLYSLFPSLLFLLVQDLNANGSYAYGFGYNVDPSGDYSFATGYFSEASGFSSISMGYLTQANHWAIAIGGDEGDYNISAEATGNGSIAIGIGIQSSNFYSIGIGYMNNSSGYGSVSIGRWNDASGSGSFAAGYNTDAWYDYSTSMGYSSQAKALYSFAMGRSVTARSQNAFVVGFYNDPISTVDNDNAPDRPLFIVGNGSSSTPSNAFLVKANGDVVTDGVIYGNGSGLTGLASGQIQTSGTNIGIGHTPSEKLDVDGDTWIRGSGSSIAGNTLSNASLRIGNTLGMDNKELYFEGVDGIIGTLTNHYLSFRTNKTERMRITGGGNIRVGTGNPTSGYKLDVGGALQVDGNADVQSLTVGGNTAVTGALTVSGNAAVTGTLSVQPRGGIGMGGFTN